MSVTTSISKEYLEALKKKGLYEGSDNAKLSKLSKEAELRNGKGYSAEQMRNFLTRQYSCTTDVVNLITSYYVSKEELHEEIKQRQANLINQFN